MYAFDPKRTFVTFRLTRVSIYLFQYFTLIIKLAWLPMDSVLIRKSLQEVNKNLLLLILSGVCSTIIIGGVWASFSLVGVAIGILLDITIFGRISASISSYPTQNFMGIIQTNLLNYVVVVLLLATPIFILRIIAKSEIGGLTYYFIEQIARMVIAIATIYVIPIVFLKKNSFISIPAGIIYLSSSLQASVLIIFIVVSEFILGTLCIFLATSLEPILAIPLIILIRMGISYLLFLAFAGACHTLTHSKGHMINAN